MYFVNLLNASFYSNFFLTQKEANPIFRKIAKVLTLPLKVSDRDISQKSGGLVPGSVHSADRAPPRALGGQIALLVILNMCKF